MRRPDKENTKESVFEPVLTFFECVDRELNPGLSVGNAQLYHSTTDAIIDLVVEN